MSQPVVRIYGIPMDLGQSRRGVDMGPSAIRYAGISTRLRQLGFLPIDAGNITVPQAEEAGEAYDPQANARFLPQVAHVCQSAHDLIAGSLEPDDMLSFSAATTRSASARCLRWRVTGRSASCGSMPMPI